MEDNNDYVEKVNDNKKPKVFNPLKNKVDVEGTQIKYKVSPKINPVKLLKGDVFGGVAENTKISLNITHKAEDTVELFVNINGKPFKVNDDGTVGTYNATFGATKTF